VSAVNKFVELVVSEWITCEEDREK